MGIRFWLMVVGFILGFVGFLNSIIVLKKLKGRLIIQRADDDVLDDEEKRLLKLNVLWSSIICLGAILELISYIFSLFPPKI